MFSQFSLVDLSCTAGGSLISFDVSITAQANPFHLCTLYRNLYVGHRLKTPPIYEGQLILADTCLLQALPIMLLDDSKMTGRNGMC